MKLALVNPLNTTQVAQGLVAFLIWCTTQFRLQVSAPVAQIKSNKN